MVYFVFQGTDRADAAALRHAIREEHRAYIRIASPDCRVVAGGPLTDDADAHMFGTLLVLEATDRSAALAYLARDPYAKAGLFAATELTRWRWGLGTPT